MSCQVGLYCNFDMYYPYFYFATGMQLAISALEIHLERNKNVKSLGECNSLAFSRFLDTSPPR